MAVHDVDIELNEHNIHDLMREKKAYVRAEYAVLRNGDDTSVIKLNKGPGNDLFRDLESVSVLSLPKDTIFVEDDSVDVLNMPSLARLRDKYAQKIIVIKGMFSHINFIENIDTVKLRVIDNIPTSPSKLSILVNKALDSGFVEHPIVVEKIDIDLAAKLPLVKTKGVMFPCRVSGLSAEMPVYFLDDAPKMEHEVTLIGCNLSRRIFEAVYGTAPAFINVCPADNVPDDNIISIVKCCKVKEGYVIDGNTAKVPWGATVPEVVEAINALFALK